MSQLQFHTFSSPKDAPRLTEVINRAFESDHFFKLPKYYNRASVPGLLEQLNDNNLTYYLGVLQPTEEQQNADMCSGLAITWQIEIISTSSLPSTETSTETHETDDTNNTNTTFIFSNTEFNSPDSDEKLIALFKPALLISTDDHSKQSQLTVRFLPKVSTVSVHPDKQGQGLGKQLIKGAELYIIERAKEFFNTLLPQRLFQLSLIPDPDVSTIDSIYSTINRIVAIQLEVLVSVRPELLPFYSKLGFRVTVEKIPFSATFICLPQYKFDSTIMEKDFDLF